MLNLESRKTTINVFSTKNWIIPNRGCFGGCHGLGHLWRNLPLVLFVFLFFTILMGSFFACVCFGSGELRAEDEVKHVLWSSWVGTRFLLAYYLSTIRLYFSKSSMFSPYNKGRIHISIRFCSFLFLIFFKFYAKLFNYFSAAHSK